MSLAHYLLHWFDSHLEEHRRNEDAFVASNQRLRRIIIRQAEQIDDLREEILECHDQAIENLHGRSYYF